MKSSREKCYNITFELEISTHDIKKNLLLSSVH